MKVDCDGRNDQVPWGPLRTIFFNSIKGISTVEKSCCKVARNSVYVVEMRTCKIKMLVGRAEEGMTGGTKKEGAIQSVQDVQ
ncbi:hypothetical protein SUGI_0277260 [Cryptomeria japonica]|nr:hypothetical protein SUGI_0277260 [Cryptomeria japonica]